MAVVRGTTSGDDVWTDYNSVVGDRFLGCGQNSRDLLDAYLSSDEVKEYAAGYGITLSQDTVHLWITGHSLGGSTAGVLSTIAVNDSFGALGAPALEERTYAYTLNAPQYVHVNWGRTYSNVWNIANKADLISGFVLPTRLLEGFWRAGHVVDFEYKKETATDELIRLYGGRQALEEATQMSFYEHFVANDLAYLLSSDAPGTSSRARYITVHCPVDVRVYDSSGNLIAWTDGDEAGMTTASAAAFAYEAASINRIYYLGGLSAVPQSARDAATQAAGL